MWRVKYYVVLETKLNWPTNLDKTKVMKNVVKDSDSLGRNFKNEKTSWIILTHQQKQQDD